MVKSSKTSNLSFVPARDLESHAFDTSSHVSASTSRSTPSSVKKPTAGSSVFGSSLGSISTHSSTKSYNTSVTGVLNRALGEHVPLWATHARPDTDSSGVIRFWLVAFVVTGATVLLAITGVLTALIAKAFLENQVPLLQDAKDQISLLPVGEFVGMNIGIGLSFLMSLIGCVLGAIGGLGFFTSSKKEASRSPLVRSVMRYFGVIFSIGIVALPPIFAAAAAAFTWELNVRGVYLYYLVSYLMMLLRTAVKSRLGHDSEDNELGGEKERSALVQILDFVFTCAWNAAGSYVAYLAVTRAGYWGQLPQGDALVAIMGCVGGNFLVPGALAYEVLALATVAVDVSQYTVMFSDW